MRRPGASVRRSVAAIAATLAVCLTPAALTAGEDRIVIEIRDFAFVPDQPAVSPGDIVVWKNLDIVPHSVTANDESWDSGLIEAGGTWETVITEEMALAYYCRYHPAMAAMLRPAPE